MSKTADAFTELERGVHEALKTYSNVHRGSGYNSLVTTQLYEQARDVVLDYLGLSKGHYTIVFTTPRRAELLKARLKPKNYHCLSSEDLGLPLSVRALAIDRNALPGGIPFQTGGAQPDSYHRIGSSGPGHRINSRLGRPPSSTSLRLPKPCS
jgi:hypothetical protein